ncbi:hypothetical protein A3D77_04360 [Candidatus Gottesmanbacteria bacterium RIFCSPHIGHO2_02_FULL_39_11]|uniref:Uncharacterized protein n=1 Tax=Candidatus Gottesmanbacteria bacterium RIFCSPHIGHO2_02_FULL_39_11 TaxID=1798382 RepID=A0A1F5ZKC8_9BACT|nr:MAG: hypothetical protein A3D77_04360 [Candidatus Gottesmanbacteria bacterium RIFCSPHIGHO2_02_FULL_39_11]
MNVIVTQRHIQNDKAGWIDSLENNYIKYFSSFGLTVFPLPNVCSDITCFVDAVKPLGVILSGGGDVDAKRYGQKNLKTHAVSTYRDDTESKLLHLSISRNIPVLGICRGMQFINVFFKGKLIEINNSTSPLIHSPNVRHKIELIDQKLIHLYLKNECITNSYHNKGILENTVGENINPFSLYRDIGLVEGLYHEKYPIAGIQWHPERNKSCTRLDEILINSFIKRELYWKI